MFLFVSFEIFGLFVNPLTAYAKYSWRYRLDLPEPIQMHLS